MTIHHSDDYGDFLRGLINDPKGVSAPTPSSPALARVIAAEVDPVRDGLVICQVWLRPDLSAEDGAKNAGQMVAYLTDAILRTGTPYRGLVFDVRRGPKVFGPQTRTVLEKLLALSASRKVRVAIIASDSATQVLQFRSLCAAAPTMNQVFADEPGAIRWLASGQPR